MGFSSRKTFGSVLALALLAAGGCSPRAPENRAPLADAAEGSDRISSGQFGRLTVPCRDPAAMAQALLELTRRDLADDTRVRLLDHSSDDVRLRDGPGQIVVIVYAVSETGDEPVITTTEHFLVNESCQVLHWSSAARPTG